MNKEQLDAMNAAIRSFGKTVDDPSPYEAHQGIVQCLRDVLRPTPPLKQADLLYSLRALANAPGFSKDALLSAIEYLLEANTVVNGGTPSEYGLKALMREKLE